MARAPYQVLVIPFIKDIDDKLLFALFKRSDRHIWQPVAGGGEDGETVLETAVRETTEETGIACLPNAFIELKSKAMIPANEFPEADWGPDITEIPEYSFGVEFPSQKIILSEEHTEFVWQKISSATKQVYWPSNSEALKELYQHIKK